MVVYTVAALPRFILIRAMAGTHRRECATRSDTTPARAAPPAFSADNGERSREKCDITMLEE